MRVEVCRLVHRQRQRPLVIPLAKLPLEEQRLGALEHVLAQVGPPGRQRQRVTWLPNGERLRISLTLVAESVEPLDTAEVRVRVHIRMLCDLAVGVGDHLLEARHGRN